MGIYRRLRFMLAARKSQPGLKMKIQPYTAKDLAFYVKNGADASVLDVRPLLQVEDIQGALAGIDKDMAENLLVQAGYGKSLADIAIMPPEKHGLFDSIKNVFGLGAKASVAAQPLVAAKENIQKTEATLSEAHEVFEHKSEQKAVKEAEDVQTVKAEKVEPEKQEKRYKPRSRKELLNYVNNEDISLADIDISEVTDLHDLFKNSTRKDFSGIGDWDVSHVKNMGGLFENAKFFDADLSKWDTHNVTNMHHIFKGADSFTHSVANFDVSHLPRYDMEFVQNDMFYECKGIRNRVKADYKLYSNGINLDKPSYEDNLRLCNAENLKNFLPFPLVRVGGPNQIDRVVKLEYLSCPWQEKGLTDITKLFCLHSKEIQKNRLDCSRVDATLINDGKGFLKDIDFHPDVCPTFIQGVVYDFEQKIKQFEIHDVSNCFGNAKHLNFLASGRLVNHSPYSRSDITRNSSAAMYEAQHEIDLIISQGSIKSAEGSVFSAEAIRKATPKINSENRFFDLIDKPLTDHSSLKPLVNTSTTNSYAIIAEYGDSKKNQNRISSLLGDYESAKAEEKKQHALSIADREADFDQTSSKYNKMILVAVPSNDTDLKSRLQQTVYVPKDQLHPLSQDQIKSYSEQHCFKLGDHAFLAMSAREFCDQFGDLKKDDLKKVKVFNGPQEAVKIFNDGVKQAVRKDKEQTPDTPHL